MSPRAIRGRVSIVVPLDGGGSLKIESIKPLTNADDVTKFLYEAIARMTPLRTSTNTSARSCGCDPAVLWTCGSYPDCEYGLEKFPRV